MTSPGAAFQTVLSREKGHKYDVEHGEGLFYLRTNQGFRNFRLVTAPVSDPVALQLEGADPAPRRRALRQRRIVPGLRRGLREVGGPGPLRVFDIWSREWRDVGQSESVYAALLTPTPEYTSHTFRYQYQSMVTPPRVYDCDMATGRQTLLKEQGVPGGYERNQYVTERQWAVGSDGVKVPLSIVYRKWLKQDGSAPLLLYGYGSYGLGIPAGFSSSRLALLDRDVAYVIAHVRGGNEMGETWHDDGMLLKNHSRVWLIITLFCGFPDVTPHNSTAISLAQEAKSNAKHDSDSATNRITTVSPGAGHSAGNCRWHRLLGWRLFDAAR